jgi:hypothetical protein
MMTVIDEYKLVMFSSTVPDSWESQHQRTRAYPDLAELSDTIVHVYCIQ